MSLYALLWVVRPQPAQPYRTSFLAVTLAMTLLAYWPLTGGRAASKEERAQGGDNPGPLDWALAAVAVVSLVHPLLVFDDFARRVVLESSGAGRFFIDVSFAASGTRSAAAPGRTATLAGFLLGTVSGSGVATT